MPLSSSFSFRCAALAALALAYVQVLACDESSAPEEPEGATTSASVGAGGDGDPIPASSTAATGTPCDETPCKLVTPQCGCGEGEACTLLDMGDRFCAPAGTLGAGEECSDAPCAPGFLCATVVDTSLAVCQQFCAADANCTGPGNLCIIPLASTDGTPIPDAKLCTGSCEPTTNVGCPADGVGCRLGTETGGQGRAYTYCAAAGLGAQGDPCTVPADCAPTLGCFDTGTETACLGYCQVAAPNCPVGSTCVAIEVSEVDVVIGDIHYGACIPR